MDVCSADFCKLTIQEVADLLVDQDKKCVLCRKIYKPNKKDQLYCSKSCCNKVMCKRYKLLLKILDKLERGLYTGGLDSYWCSETISWLWKWRKITEKEKNELCERVINLHR